MVKECSTGAGGADPNYQGFPLCQVFYRHCVQNPDSPVRGYYRETHFPDKEALRNEVTSPRSQSWGLTDPEFKSKFVPHTHTFPHCRQPQGEEAEGHSG